MGLRKWREKTKAQIIVIIPNMDNAELTRPAIPIEFICSAVSVMMRAQPSVEGICSDQHTAVRIHAKYIIRVAIVSSHKLFNHITPWLLWLYDN